MTWKRQVKEQGKKTRLKMPSTERSGGMLFTKLRKKEVNPANLVNGDQTRFKIGSLSLINK